jgi:hypothetical protein
MHGTHRRCDGGARAYAVDLLARGFPAQMVTQMTGVQAAPLRPLAALVRSSAPVVRLGLTRSVPDAPADPVPPPPVDHFAPQSAAQQVLRDVAKAHGLTLEGLRGRRKDNRHVVPRQEAMYRLHRLLGLPSTTTARLLGRRDHTTVLWGVRRHLERVGGEA